MTHDQLVRRGVVWLRNGCPAPGDQAWNRRRHQRVYAEMRAIGLSPECPDVIGWHNGVSTVIECKTSRSDYAADRRKSHMQSSENAMGVYRYVLVPDGLVRPEECYLEHGLLYANKHRVEVVLAAPHRRLYNAVAECTYLLSAIRRTELRSGFDKRSGRWESDLFRKRRTRPVPCGCGIIDDVGVTCAEHTPKPLSVLADRNDRTRTELGSLDRFPDEDA